MGEMDQISQVMSHRNAQALKASRGALPEFDQVRDDSWLYDESYIDARYGVPYADTANWPTRAPSDAPTLADITLRRDEMICSACHLVHRPGVECP